MQFWILVLVISTAEEYESVVLTGASMIVLILVSNQDAWTFPIREHVKDQVRQKEKGLIFPISAIKSRKLF